MTRKAQNQQFDEYQPDQFHNHDNSARMHDEDKSVTSTHREVIQQKFRKYFNQAEQHINSELSHQANISPQKHYNPALQFPLESITAQHCSHFPLKGLQPSFAAISS